MKCLVVVGIAIAIFSGAPLQAQILELSFSGEVISTGSDGTTGVPAVVGGGTISQADSVTGILRFDSNASPDLVEGTTGALYRTEAPLFYKVTINGIEFSNDGEFGIFVANDNPGGAGDVDVFGLQDGSDPLNPGWFTGDTMLINQQQRNAATSFSLTDFSASVYDSLDLPSDVDLSDFDSVLRLGDILGNNENGVRFNLTYRITSIDVSTVALLGDCNLDGVVSFLDISPFISLLSLGDYLVEADTNEDGSLDFLDISPFISLLSSN